MPKITHNLRLHIGRKVRDIPRQEWEGLFPSSIIENYDYYKTLDESNLPFFSTYYAVVYEAGSIIAIAPFFTTEFSFDTTIQGYIKKVILLIQKRFPRFLKLKMLFFGSPLTEEGAIAISEGRDAKEILDFLIREITKFCRSKKIAVITFYNLTTRDRYVLDFLKKRGFGSMEAFPLTRLSIKEGTLEQYIQNLGRSTRKDIRRKLRKAYAAAEIRIEERNTLNGLLEQAYRLYLNNLNKSDVSFERLTPEYFSKVSENMPDIAKFFIVWINKKMAAFNLCFIKDDFCIDKYIGFDYDLAYRYNLYYVTWCYNIDWCIRNGIRYYQPGTCDYDPKLRLGGELVPLYISTRLINPVLNIFTTPVLKLIEPRRFDPVLKKLTRL